MVEFLLVTLSPLLLVTGGIPYERQAKLAVQYKGAGRGIGQSAVYLLQSSRHGHQLHNPSEDGIMVCTESGWRYKEVEPGVLRCLDWPEDEPLP